MFVLLAVLIATVSATKWYAGPKGFTFEDSPMVFLMADKKENQNPNDADIRSTINQCYDDKSYWFKLHPLNGDDNTDVTKRTFTMQYYDSSQCTNVVLDRSLEIVFYKAYEANSEEQMKKDYPLWIHFSTSGAGHDNNKLLQFSKEGCVNGMGFQFKFSPGRCYHHMYDDMNCGGIDRLAKHVYNGERWGSGIFYVNATIPDEDVYDARYCEGDRGFFTYLDLAEVLKYSIDTGDPKVYVLDGTSLKTYKKTTERVPNGNKHIYEYWQDAFQNANTKNKITNAILCPSKDSCTTETTGVEYIITNECVTDKVFIQTCEDVIRIRQEGADTCNTMFTENEERPIVVSTDENHIMYFNESYFFVNMTNAACPKMSCNTTSLDATEFTYAIKGVENEQNQLRYHKYQFTKYMRYNKYLLQTYYENDSFKKLTSMKFIGNHQDDCVPLEQKELHFYRHLKAEECSECWGWAASRADFFRIEECINNKYWYVDNQGAITLYDCEGNESHNDMFKKLGSLTAYQKIQQYGCEEFDNVDYFVWFSVSPSKFDNTEETYVPVYDSFCQEYHSLPEPTDEPEDSSNSDSSSSVSSGSPSDGDDTETNTSSGNNNNDDKPTESGNASSGNNNDDKDDTETNTSSGNNNNKDDDTETNTSSGNNNNDDNKPNQPGNKDNDINGSSSITTILIIIFITILF